jgi:hypothetical protein
MKEGDRPTGLDLVGAGLGTSSITVVAATGAGFNAEAARVVAAAIAACEIMRCLPSGGMSGR